MEVIYVLLPLAVILATSALIAFIRAASAGQFDDLETPPYRILFEDDAPSKTRRGDAPPSTRADEQQTFVGAILPGLPDKRVERDCQHHDQRELVDVDKGPPQPGGLDAVGQSVAESEQEP